MPEEGSRCSECSKLDRLYRLMRGVMLCGTPPLIALTLLVHEIRGLIQ